MRNSSKINTLESKFPILAIEQDCLLTKEADISVGFEVQLPELFTISGEDYEILHSLWHKAIKVLPQYTVIHKQDWFIKEQYEPELQGENLSFLSHSYEKHFNERPFLNHRCYLFITQTTKNRMRAQSNFSSLCKGNFLPKELTNRKHATQFLEAVAQLEHILNDSNLIKLRQLKTDDYIGTPHKKGLFEQYLSLSTDEKESLQDICLSAEQMRIGNQRLCVHTLSDTEDLPSKVQADSRYERLSTDKSDCRLSFAAPVGLLLSCNHIYNQYLFLDNSDENLRQFEKSARNMHSLSRYSRSNQINKEWIEQYLNEAHSYGFSSIRAHFNVMAWSDNPQELRSIKNDVGSALASMECKPRHNTIDTATLYWAGIAGNAADFPSEETFYTFIEPALCFFTQETNYQSSSSPFGIKMADRLTGKPIHLDISDEPMKKGIITNRNKFVLGPSGSGKSFFTNHLVRQYYEQGTHFTAPSYICGLSKPSFVLADIMIGGSNDEENINFFLTKINTIKKTHKKSNFIPYLITDFLSNEALSKLKENGIVIGLIDKLFGREYKELMESLIRVITNISVILKKEPNKFIEIIKKFDKLIDGKTNNLRGDLFEFIVGYYHSNLCQSIEIDKNYRDDDDGKKKEVDVYASYQDKIILCECKAYKTPISLEIIEEWNEKIAFIYKVIEKNRSFTGDKNRDIIFEFWSISGFSEEATQYFQEKKNNLKKYKIDFYKRDEILKKAKDSNANKITDIMNEYFANDDI
ncbi:hypothetical protein RCZ15_26460 [Capnocytophaga catalasegens]|uniref:Conjugal transfer protein TraG n=1 Tax=Capnocytophaga catalasegens TaxID=1004260 RepID=A0AAV5AW76_9FLAO|nr:TraG family conjugative transposon ATPase [Capnocytophaga catalasegens]GIZ16602.1 hypothetical protein RCZ03_26020 [Capnocytophaga catalasegens]GJM51673.1 hypothetical protein RCZ15_26460 [Capnocytophaga catalasegens]GJM51718.1 hypothetical protein RCZ16_00360 [Capnocytophaga catalasegens]